MNKIITKLLPDICSDHEFDKLLVNEKLCLSVAEAICNDHDLPKQCQKYANGSQLVIKCGKKYVIKVFAPSYYSNWKTECLFLDYLQGKLSIIIPKIFFMGKIDAWFYIVMEQLEGIPLSDIFSTLSFDEKLKICGSLGKILKSLHLLPCSQVKHPELDWISFFQNQKAKSLEQQKKTNLDSFWLEKIENYLANIDFSNSKKEVILHTEIMPAHIMVSENNPTKIIGLIDFEPAMLGDSEYDFPSLAIFITSGQKDLFKAFLLNYGYKEHELNSALQKRLFGYLLLHRYSNLNWYLKMLPKNFNPDTLYDLARYWFPV